NHSVKQPKRYCGADRKHVDCCGTVSMIVQERSPAGSWWHTMFWKVDTDSRLTDYVTEFLQFAMYATGPPSHVFSVHLRHQMTELIVDYRSTPAPFVETRATKVKAPVTPDSHGLRLGDMHPSSDWGIGQIQPTPDETI